MIPHRYILVIAGAVATGVISFASVMAHGPELIASVHANAVTAHDAADGGFAMPLWLEILILMQLTYAAGLGIGWLCSDRGGRPQ